MKKILLLSLTLLFVINAFALDAPTQNSPTDGSTNQQTNVTLWITHVAGATEYDYLLDTVSTFDSPALRTKTHTSSYSGWITSDLYYGKTYYWKIRARNASETSDWSASWSFSTHNIGVSQSSPVNEASNLDVSLTLWITKLGSENYDYQFDTVPTFDSPLLHEHSHNSSYGGHTVNDLLYGQTYYWRVRGRNDSDTSGWTSIWNFTTKNFGVTQQSPINNSIDANLQLTLYINKVTGSENYDYQFDTVPTFDSPLLHEQTHNSSYSGHTVSDLFYNQIYYWRVRGRNDSDTSEWTSIWNFTTKNYGVTQQSPVNNSTDINLQVSLYINKVTGSENYDYQFDTVPTFDSPLLHEHSHNSSYSGHTVSDLFYDQMYYWRVRGRNDTDTSEWTTIWNFTTKNYGVTQQSPANNATDIDVETSLYINKVTGSENYDYEVDTVSTFDSPYLQERTHNDAYSGITVSDLYYGQTYYWKVRGRNTTDTSNWTSIWDFTTKNIGAVPSSPANGSSQIHPRSAVYSTKYAGSENIDYQLDTTANFNSPALIELSHTEAYSGINHDTLYFGKTYYWRVRGRHDVDTSNWSFVRNFSIIDFVPLTSPAHNALEIAIDPYLNWDDISGNEGYTCEIDTSSEFNSTLLQQLDAPTNQSYIYPTTLKYGTTYFWRVKAKHSVDTSGYTIRNFKTEYELTNAPILISPENNSTGITYESFLIEWNSILNANSYQYQISTTNDFLSLVKNGNTSLTNRTITDLQQNTKYYWRIRGENVNGYSPWSSVWNFTTETEAPTLISPSNNSTEVDYNEITFTWTESAGTYWIQISDDETFATILDETNSPTNSETYSGFSPNTIYYWRVSNDDGYFNWSEIWNFTTMEEPATLDAPILVSPVNGATNELTELTLNWNTVTDATEYEYQYSTDYTFATFVSGTTSANEILISGLDFNSEYFWRVMATDGSIYSNWSEVWSFTTKTEILDIPVLLSPINEASNQLTELTLDWNSVTNAISYEYQYSTNFSFTTYEGGITSNTEFMISELNYNTEYFWRVQATDGSLFSDWSEVWSFTTEENIDIDEINKIDINIYPNPADNILYINSDRKIDLISISDITGKVVYLNKVSKLGYTIYTDNFIQGAYFIKIRYSNKYSYRKVIINH